jgi:precorrin-6A synthase
VILLIGIGAGDPDHVTLQAVAAINAFDVLFVVTKEQAEELTELRRAVVARHRTRPYRTVALPDPPRPWREAPDYRAAVATWREQRAALWRRAFAELPPGETGAFLVWGDPSLYESTLAIVGELGVDHEVIPGVSSLHALTARHKIPLNRVGRAVQITPARLLADGLPENVDDVVVMLDAHATFTTLAPDGIDIYWGAYLGTPDEMLMSGPLSECAAPIRTAREEAKARKGWIFDIYLLRRCAS